MKFLLLFPLPFLASAGPNGGRYTVREWSVVKSVPLMVRDYVGLINDFTVCRHCAEGVPDARFITRRPAQSIDEIVSGLAERAIPQLLGLMEIVTKTGEVVTVKYGTPDAKNLSIAGDVEHHSKSWYVLMRLSQMRNKLRTLAEEGTVYGRATNYGAELKQRFNTRFAGLNESLAASHGNLTTLTQRLFKAEVNAEPKDLSLQARRKFELRQDQVSKEAAWALLDFMSSILVPNRHVDACLYGANPPLPAREDCRGKMTELIDFLEDELIPFLRTIYGVAWEQTLPYRHAQWRDTFPGWFSYAMANIVDFEAAGVGLAYRDLEVGIFKLQRHLDSLRKFRREDPSHLAQRLEQIRHSSAKAIETALQELETHTVYMGAAMRQGSVGGKTRFVFFSPETVRSIQMSLLESAGRFYDW
ncbi:hypothetical protein PG995_003240 [Apiospora arundinis]